MTPVGLPTDLLDLGGGSGDGTREERGVGRAKRQESLRVRRETVMGRRPDRGGRGVICQKSQSYRRRIYKLLRFDLPLHRFRRDRLLLTGVYLVRE